MTAKAPNILLVIADQMAPAFLPVYGHRLTRAPNIEGLASSGVVFESAYCNSPLCSPSRASLMSGRLPSRTRVYDNASEFSADIPTFAHCLRLQGYRTILSGKMHFCGPDQLHGFEERLTTDVYPADFRWTPDWDHPQDRPSWYHNMSSVTQAGVCVRTNQLDFDDEVAFMAERAIFDIARSRDKRPFLLAASFTHPHDPFAVPQRYWDLYRHEDIDMPVAAGRDRRARSAFEAPQACLRDGRRADHGCSDAQRPPRLLWRDFLYRRPDRTADGGAARGWPRRGYDRHPDQRPRRDAGRTRPLVQDELLRGRLPGSAHLRQSRPLRAGPGRRKRLARRYAADAGRPVRRRRAIAREHYRRAQPGPASERPAPATTRRSANIWRKAQSRPSS